MQSNSSRSFDDIWNRIDSQTIKRIARLFGGKITWRKNECVDYLRKAINEPERIQAILKTLPPYEYSLLRFIKESGGEVTSSHLKMVMYASGVSSEMKGPNFLDPFQSELQKLLNTGLAFNRTTYGSPTQLRNYYSYHDLDIIYSDDRILEHVPLPEYQTLAIEPAPPPAHPVSRAPHLVTMQVIGVLNEIDRINGIKVTMDGRPRATEVRKLAKNLGWSNNVLADGDLSIENAVELFVYLFRLLELVTFDNQVLTISPLAREFGSLPIYKQVRLLLLGLFENDAWHEFTPKFGYYSNVFDQARIALFTLLRCLPPTPGAYFRVADLDNALFQRIGEFFSLRGILPRFYNFDRNPATSKIQLDQWLGDRRADWLKSESVWIESALTTWLYFLGIVSLDMHKGKPEVVGLTDLGRQVLAPDNGDDPVVEEPAAVEGAAAWVVQPNFDIIAYLNRLSSSQLMFLEQHAERVRAQEHVAEYHLTRDSIYRGLEGGSTIEDVLRGLQNGSEKELPQNITVEIQEWAALRERITLYRNTQLAEFPDRAAREAAIRSGIYGTAVGDRFLMLTDQLNKAQSKRFPEIVDYRRSPVRNLIFDETGKITFQSNSNNLVMNSRLLIWTEPDEEGNRKFTRESIQKAVAAGYSINNLLKLIDEHSARLIPPILRLALNNWSGQETQVGLNRILVLQSPNPEVTYALHHSTSIRRYLRGTISPGYFMVNEKDLEALRVQLEAFGMSILLDSTQPKH
jgi:hypothetical protein